VSSSSSPALNGRQSNSPGPSTMYMFLSRFYNCTDSRRANQVSTGSAVSSSIPPLESFRGPAGFREKVFLGAVAERSSVPIKYEAIGDTSNASDVRGASVEMDSSSIYGHQVQSLTIPTVTKTEEFREDINAQSATKDGSDHTFEMDKYVEDSGAEATEVVME